jgi:DNA repair photolyase
MAECKHGLKHGCVYCHARPTPAPARPSSAASRPAPKRASRSTRLSEQMNDRMTNLKKRLRQIRGE